MADRQFKPDLTGSNETLERLLERLRSYSVRAPFRSWDLPADRDFRFTSGRPPRGAGSAEAPIPKDAPLPDLCAPN
jgi:hypothetical protein